MKTTYSLLALFTIQTLIACTQKIEVGDPQIELYTPGSEDIEAFKLCSKVLDEHNNWTEQAFFECLEHRLKMDRDLAECITCETFTPGGCATSENVACLDVLEEDDLTVILCFSNQLVNGNVDFLQCLTHPEQYGENTEEDTSPEEIPCENRAKQHARDHFETCLNADTYENGDAPTELECLNQASEVSDRYIEMFCKDTDESMEA